MKRLQRADGVLFDENATLKPHHTDSKAIPGEVFLYRKKVASHVVPTKNWCQDVWSSRYVPVVFDPSDATLSLMSLATTGGGGGPMARSFFVFGA